jgi:hypothetical protein
LYPWHNVGAREEIQPAREEEALKSHGIFEITPTEGISSNNF